MQFCIFCGYDAEYVIQWGPKSDQKEYVCTEHVPNLLKRISAPEAFIVKIEKVDNTP